MTEALDNYYAILDIEMGADTATIEQAVKASRKRWRQMQGSPDKDRARLAEQRMEQLEAASEILLDDTRRAQYDAQLTQQLATPSAPAAATAATDWAQRAREYYENGDVRNAFTAAKKGTDVASEDPNCWFYYVLSAIDLKRLEDADFASAELVHRLPGAHTSHDLRGSVLDQMRRYKEAEISFRTAAKLEPSRAYYHGRAAWAVLDQGRIDEAVSEARDVAARFPGDEYPGRVLRAAVDALREAKRPADALALARELLTGSMPNDEDLILSAILAVQEMEKRGDVGTACTEAWNLLDLFPGDAQVQRLTRYVVYSLQGRGLDSDALAWARALQQRFPHDPEFAEMLASCILTEAEGQMAQTSPTTHSILNKAQAEHMTRALQEIDSLQLSDPEMLGKVNAKREFLAKQTKTVANLSFGKVLLAIAALILVLIMGFPNLPGGILFVLLGGFLGWVFWIISFPKQYKLNFKAQTPAVRQTGLQK